MSRLERIQGVAFVPTGMNPVDGEGFEPGKYYEQVDLESRCAVEGLARLFNEGDSDVSFFAIRAAEDIAIANDRSPGEYVVYTGEDEQGDQIACVYQKVD